VVVNFGRTPGIHTIIHGTFTDELLKVVSSQTVSLLQHKRSIKLIDFGGNR
jgi:hypothetical protein